MVSLTVNFAGEARRRVPIAFAALAADAAIGVLLIPRVGVTGGAISSDVGYGIYVAGHLWVCRRVLGLPLAPLLSTFVRAAIAAAGMAAVMAAFGTDHLGVASWVLGAALGIATYASLLLATGAVRVSELRDARERWNRRRGPREDAS